MIRSMIGAQKSFKKLISNSMKTSMLMNTTRHLPFYSKTLLKQFADNYNKLSLKKMMKTEVTSPPKTS